MKRIIYILLSACLLFTACEENERMPYSGDPSVYFYERMLSAAVIIDVYDKTYSFADKASTLQEDTVYVKAKLMGYTADKDRTFKAIVVGDSSAVAEENDTVFYKVLDGVIKAGEIEGYLPVVVYRTTRIKENTLQITLKIVDSEANDLKAATPGNLIFTVYWADKLIKPANWDASLAYFFGTYSDTKYQFIIDVLGISQFDIYTRFNTTGIYTTADMYDFANRLKEALRTYNAAHDPDLTDETGALVTFP